MSEKLQEKLPASIGVYARKSKFTGKGKSVQNQIKICIDYENRLLIRDRNEINI